MKRYIPLSKLYQETSFYKPVPPLGRQAIILPEVAAAGGFEYEKRVAYNVKNVIEQNNLINIKFRTGEVATAGASNVGADIELTVNGKPVDIEVKKDRKAQMGSTSLRIDLDSGKVVIANPEGVEESTVPLIVDAGQQKIESIKKFVDFIKKQQPVSLHTINKNSLPLSVVEYNAWVLAQQQGYLKKLNEYAKIGDVSPIVKHYNQKNIFYIQIGGAGLFYLGNNPYKLPVPEFTGTCTLEFRLGRSGSKERLFEGKKYKVVAASYRVTARLNTDISSPYSLDNIDQTADILNLLQKNV